LIIMVTKPITFLETFEMKATGPTTSVTTHPPEQMGNSAAIAYGGHTLAVAVKAAANSVPMNYRLYSLLGQYLGPALTDRVLKTTIREIRQTRTFATRLVEVSQKTDSGEDRACVIALADFQVPEVASLLEYHVKPMRLYTHHSKLEDGPTQRQRQVDEGKAPQALKDAFEIAFGLMQRFFETKPCPEGVFAQTMNGIMKKASTTQDGLPAPEKSTADWVKTHETFPGHAENMAALVFQLDGAAGFLGLGFNNLFIDDAGAASSLDFAMRVFDNEIDMGRWHLKELISPVAAEGRTFTEARLWSEDGACVAHMTQQTILRPVRGKGKL
jgi:acyl-CoA thioesterase II